jgi:polyhydroxyalkanoate synthesis regulator phasin
MDRIVRTFLLAALGALEAGEDRARTFLDDLEQRGEGVLQEARAVAEHSARRAAERRAGHERNLRGLVAEELARQQVASHASVTSLTERVAALEDAVAALKNRAMS